MRHHRTDGLLGGLLVGKFRLSRLIPDLRQPLISSYQILDEKRCRPLL